MTIIDLTESELFKNLVETTMEDIYIDLHNDYNCSGINYKGADKNLVLLFEKIDRSKPFISIRFENTVFDIVNLNFKSILKSLTLDNFYRGRFEIDNSLKEYSDEGQGYFYLEFYEDCSIQLFSNSVKLLVDN